MRMTLRLWMVGVLAGLAVGATGCRQPAPVRPGTGGTAETGPAASAGGTGGFAPRYSGLQAASQGGSLRPRRARPNTAATPGDFDFYVLNLSWEPAYCQTHATAAECAKGSGFVLHGLWPQDTNGTYPQDCSHEPGPADAQNYVGLYPNQGLLEHEWTVHGTCSGMSPDAYFTEVRRALGEIKVPAGLATIGSAAPGAIVAQFAQANPGFPAGSFVVSCGANQLTAVEVCLAKDLTAASCASVRGCGAGKITVTAP